MRWPPSHRTYVCNVNILTGRTIPFCAFTMPHVQRFDDEVSINFKDPSETILSYNKGLDHKSKIFDEDETLGYSLPNDSVSKSETLKETSISNMS